MVVPVAGLLMLSFIVAGCVSTAPDEEAPGSARVVLDIERMHCDKCPVTIRRALLELDGVIEARVTLEPPEAIVVYDPDIVSIGDITAATRNVGYPSSPRKAGS